MSYYIVIKEYKHTDLAQVTEVVRNAYISNVFPSFINALTREITLQLVVACAAILFIFMGVPLAYCIIAIPIVIIIIFLIIYSSFYFKAMELMNKRALQCWVAEACQPFFTTEQQLKTAQYRILTEDALHASGIDVGPLSRRIVGTVAVTNYTMLDDTAWLYRLAVHKDLRNKGIGHALVDTVKSWSRMKNYSRVLLAISECQESTRQLFITTGFNMKQMYHKQLFGQIITLLMYQLECDLCTYQ